MGYIDIRTAQGKTKTEREHTLNQVGTRREKTREKAIRQRGRQGEAEKSASQTESQRVKEPERDERDEMYKRRARER